jgi:threonine/homoserine/homoserine lactone efflux protein
VLPFLFLKAALLGLSVAAPVGPIGILCIRRTLSDGQRIGFASGLGAATADALYGVGAALGLAIASTQTFAGPLRLAGGAYLFYLGVRTFRSPPGETAANVSARGAFQAWSSTFFLTVTNPMTLMSFAAMFSAIGMPAGGATLAVAATLVGGVFLGSAAWWLGLSTAVGAFRARVTPQHLVWINRAAGVALIGFALFCFAGSGWRLR